MGYETGGCEDVTKNRQKCLLDVFPGLYQLYTIKIISDTGGVNDRDLPQKSIWHPDEAKIISSLHAVGHQNVQHTVNGFQCRLEHLTMCWTRFKQCIVFNIVIPTIDEPSSWAFCVANTAYKFLRPSSHQSSAPHQMS